MRIEQLIEVATDLEELIEDLGQKKIEVMHIKARVGVDPMIDVTVTVDHDVYAVRVGSPV
jgi:hypothetical protein